MQHLRLTSVLLLPYLSRGTDISYDITGSTSFYLNEAGTVNLVGGELGRRPVMCYSDYGNLELTASLTCRLFASANALDDDEGATAVVSSRTNEAISFAQLDSANAVVCYAAFARSEGRPTCNVLSLWGSSNLTVGPDLDVSFDGPKPDTYIERTTVTGLSSTSAVMCYRQRATSINGVLRCVSLSRDGDELSMVGGIVVNNAFTFAASVTGLSDALAMVCYTDDHLVSRESMGYCDLLSLSSDSMEWVEGIALHNTTLTQDVAAVALSPTFAVVCFTEGDAADSDGDALGEAGDCMSVEVSATRLVRKAQISVTVGQISHLSLKSFSDETAVLCYMDGSQQGLCVELFASEDVLTKGSPYQLEDPIRGPAPKRAAIARVSDSKGVVCYTEQGSGEGGQQWGRCVAVDVVPSSTGTQTSSTSATSTTSPHTTTGTSTLSSTSSSGTSSSETSTTSLHSTTETSSATFTSTTATKTTMTATTETVRTSTTVEVGVENSGTGRSVSSALSAIFVLAAGFFM